MYYLIVKQFDECMRYHAHRLPYVLYITMHADVLLVYSKSSVHAITFECVFKKNICTNQPNDIKRSKAINVNNRKSYQSKVQSL